jgi:hypothetical protein
MSGVAEHAHLLRVGVVIALLLGLLVLHHCGDDEDGVPLKATVLSLSSQGS